MKKKRKNFLPQFCLKTSVGGSASESRGIVQIQASENIGIRKFFSKCLRIFKKTGLVTQINVCSGNTPRNTEDTKSTPEDAHNKGCDIVLILLSIVTAYLFLVRPELQKTKFENLLCIMYTLIIEPHLPRRLKPHKYALSTLSPMSTSTTQIISLRNEKKTSISWVEIYFVRMEPQGLFHSNPCQGDNNQKNCQIEHNCRV